MQLTESTPLGWLTLIAAVNSTAELEEAGGPAKVVGNWMRGRWCGGYASWGRTCGAAGARPRL